MSQPLVWVLEDDLDVLFTYEMILARHYRIRLLTTLAILRKALRGDDTPSLLVADLGLPDGSFTEILASGELRAKGVPVCVVSSEDDVSRLTWCFEHGAADYLTKPFNKQELLVKCGRLLTLAPTLVDLDPKQHVAARRDVRTQRLTVREFQLLAVLREPGRRAVPRALLEEAIYADEPVRSNALNFHLVGLRKKLAPLALDVVYRASGGAFELVATDGSSV